MDAGEDVIDIVLGQHDLTDAGEALRLVFPHPQQLGGREPGEGDVGGKPAQPLLSHRPVEVLHSLRGAPVVPEDGRADHLPVSIQNHQPVHLPAGSDARHLAGVKAPQQLGDALQHGHFPVLRVLLAPAGPGEFQGVLPGYHILNGSLPVHQQQLDGGGAQIDSYVQHSGSF